MIDTAPAIPTSRILSPREQGMIFAAMLASLAICLVLPRALCFLPAVTALLSAIYAYSMTRTLPPLDKKLFGFFAALCLLAAASAFWSFNRNFALERSLKLAGLFFSLAPLLFFAQTIDVNAAKKNALTIIAVMMCAVAGLAITFEYETAFSITKSILHFEGELPESILNGYLINRNATFLTLLCFPVLLLLCTGTLTKRNKQILAAIMLACVLSALAHSASQTAQISAALGVLMLFYPSHKKIARKVLLGGIIAAMLAAPFFAGPIQRTFFAGYTADTVLPVFLDSASVPHRIEVWSFISDQIMDKPFFGHGVEATRFFYSDERLPLAKVHSVLHPHNAVLQIWVEFGLMGILLLIGFTVYLFNKLDTLPPLLQRYYTMLMIVLFGITSTGYGLWQAWQLGMIFTLCALSVAIANLNGLRKITK